MELERADSEYYEVSLGLRESPPSNKVKRDEGNAEHQANPKIERTGRPGHVGSMD